MSRQKFTFLIIILAVVVFGATFLALTAKSPEQTPHQTVVGKAGSIYADTRDSGKKSLSEKPMAASHQIDSSDWLTYRNESLGFSFRYPKWWNLEQGVTGDEVVSVSSYFINQFGGKDGSRVKLEVENNNYGSFQEWLKSNHEVFQNSDIEYENSFNFLGFPANLIKSSSPIAGGHNDRLVVFNEKTNKIFVVWMHRRIRSELQIENEKHDNILRQIVNSIKINNLEL